MSDENLEKIAGQKNATVQKRTGRTWAQWVEALDEIDAYEMEHAAIAKWLEQHIDAAWWTQTVAVGYERIRGLREVGQSRSGSFEASKSKTIRASVEDVYALILEVGEDPSWAGDLRLDGSTLHKSIRFAAADASRASLWLTAVNESKCRVSVSHTKIQTSDALKERKTWWEERLQSLADLANERETK